VPELFFENLKWMGWNLFLAALPMVVAIFLFKKEYWEKRSLWLIVYVFLLLVFYFFLPNAPYVMTDIIHLVRQIKDYRYFGLKDWDIIVVLIPQFVFYIFIGFSFYVIAFQKLIKLLYVCNWPEWLIWFIKVINTFIMSIGVFLGRFYRFNTWDIIGHSDKIIMSTIKEFSNFNFLMFVLMDSLIIFFGYEILSIFYKALYRKLFD